MWRDLFCELAEEQKVPNMQRIKVSVVHTTRTANTPDTLSCASTVKAAIDGLRDAKVIDDDTSRYVESISFSAPYKTGTDTLTLHLEEVAPLPGLVQTP